MRLMSGAFKPGGAIPRELSLGPGITRALVLEEMEGHVLGTAELMGTYSRSTARCYPAS